MRKRINFRRLGRTTKHKWAMLRNLVTSLVLHERIVTTTAKAKEMKMLAEKIITIAKKPQEVSARRKINTIVQTDQAATKVMHVLKHRYQFRQGGYTRVMKLSAFRQGDRADMSVIEYVDRPGEIRAARPPAVFRNAEDLEAAIQALGLEDSVPPPQPTTTDTDTTTASLDSSSKTE